MNIILYYQHVPVYTYTVTEFQYISFSRTNFFYYLHKRPDTEASVVFGTIETRLSAVVTSRLLLEIKV